MSNNDIEVERKYKVQFSLNKLNFLYDEVEIYQTYLTTAQD